MVLSSVTSFAIESARTALAVGALGVITAHAIAKDVQKKISSKESYYEGVTELINDIWKNEERTRKSVHEVAALEGFKIEEHIVETHDGFLLTLHRLKPVKSTPILRSKGPVLLQHGLYQSSMLYLMNKREHGLAYILADSGYDVWLGNNRGNIHSRKHVRLSSSDREFWEWGVDELAHDVEANISYITQFTGRSKVAYIGHSQGCAQALAAFSSDEALRKKVHTCILLAPGAFVRPMPCVPLRGLAKLVHRSPKAFFCLFGDRSFLPFMEHMRYFLSQRVFSYCAYTMFNYLFEWGDEYWDKSRNDMYFSDTPAGTSSRTIAHWMQQSVSGRFQRFCYKDEMNMFKYGQSEAPEYPLENIDIPTAVIYGGKDDLLDYHRLIETLPNCVLHKNIEHHAHLDSLIAVDAKALIFPDVLSILDVYSRSRDQRSWHTRKIQPQMSPVSAVA